MGRAEEVFLAAQSQEKQRRVDESERYRLECLNVHVPRLMELVREFLNEMEAKDYPINPDIFDTTLSSAGWSLQNQWYVFSNGHVIWRHTARGIEPILGDLNLYYQQPTGSDGPWSTQSSVDSVVSLIHCLQSLLAKIR